MGNKTQITFSSEHALEGARKEAKQQGISLSEYVESLVRQDLKEKLQFKIISHYSNGDTREEADFFTENDLTNSAIAYGMLLHRGHFLSAGRNLFDRL